MTRVEPPDMSWLIPARVGDRDALGAAIDACRLALIAWLSQRRSDSHATRQDPEQVVAEGCRKAVEHFEQFRGATWGEWYQWLRSICDNSYADELRRFGRQPRVHSFADLVSDIDCKALAMSDGQPRPSSEVLRRELIERIKATIPKLPSAERLAFTLHFLNDLELDEIALLLGKSYDAVRIARDRAVARLRQMLGDNSHGS